MLLISPLQFKNCFEKNYIRPTVSHKRSLELGVTCEILFSHRLVEINKHFCGPLGQMPSGAREFLPPICQRFKSPLPFPYSVSCVFRLRGLSIKRYRLSVAKPKMVMTLAGA